MPSYSIVIATYNKAELLREVVSSIGSQDVGGHFGEIIVVDDGSTDSTQQMSLSEMAESVRYVRLNDAVGVYRNPAIARNVGYRMACGDVIIAQSDEVVHADPNNIRRLVEDLKEGTFLIGTVHNVINGVLGKQYTGAARRRPLFFLGSLFRRDLYAVGGNDEEFRQPGYDDTWFGDCLIRGLGRRPVYHRHVIGHHLDHPRPNPLDVSESQRVYRAKVGSGKFISSGGPWTYYK